MAVVAPLLRRAARLHTPIALLAVLLLAGSPWLAMRRAIPGDASPFDWAHVLLGLVLLPLVAAYGCACAGRGRWRLYWPWLAGPPRALLHDLGGLLRGRRPSAEGGGLLACVEGFVLLLLLASACTGVGWLLAQATPEALAWRQYHAWAARGFAIALVLHVLGMALHVLDFVRD